MREETYWMNRMVKQLLGPFDSVDFEGCCVLY